MTREKSSLTPEQALIAKVIKKHGIATQAEDIQRKKSKDDIRFCDPENQWDPADRATREAAHKPCLSVDRMTPFVKQVTNEQRQNRPAITVTAVGDGATEEVAEIKQGMIRHIEYDSGSDMAVDTGFESMVRMGFGYMRVIEEFEDPMSFNQVLKIKRIPNAFMVHIDPSYTEADGSDMNWATIEEDIPLEMFKEKYPKAKKSVNASTDVWEDVGTQTPGWATVDAETIRLVEYYERKFIPIQLQLLDNGKVIEKGAKIPKGIKVLKERESLKPEIRWWKLNALEILEGGVEGKLVVGDYVPVIPIFGDELIIDNDRVYSGLIRHAKDVQKMINYWKSAQTHQIAMAPKAPWVGPVGFRGDRAKEWADAAVSDINTLEYEWWDPIRNQKMDKPERNLSEPAIRAITEALGQSEEDIKAVLGMFDPTQGNNKGMADQSGVAIRSLQNQGATVNFHFADNLTRALRFLGRVLLSKMPFIYDTERVTRIVEPDGATKTVTINGATDDIDLKTGLRKFYDIKSGKYDVIVDVGPSFQTKRQENLAILVKLIHEMPFVGQVAPDIVVSQTDSPITKKLVKRIQKALDPKLTSEDGKPVVDPATQQKMQGLMEMNQKLIDEVHKLSDKVMAEKMNLESKERIANLQAKTALITATYLARTKGDTEAMKADYASIEHRLNLLHEGVSLEADSMQQPTPGGDSGAASPSQPTGGPSPGQ